jgi:hypothetical protein
VTKRRMLFSGRAMNSDQWLSLATLLFPNPADVAAGLTLDKQRRGEIRYYCDSCDKDFASITTPVKCPLCKSPPGPQKITLTHKGHTQETFPFYATESGP